MNLNMVSLVSLLLLLILVSKRQYFLPWLSTGQVSLRLRCRGPRVLPPLLTILSEVSLSLFMCQCLTALTVSLVVLDLVNTPPSFETDTALVTVAALRLTHMSPEDHHTITSTFTKATTMLTRAHPSSPWTQPPLIS